jgi:hypothetical protein
VGIGSGRAGRWLAGGLGAWVGSEPGAGQSLAVRVCGGRLIFKRMGARGGVVRPRGGKLPNFHRPIASR